MLALNGAGQLCGRRYHALAKGVSGETRGKVLGTVYWVATRFCACSDMYKHCTVSTALQVLHMLSLVISPSECTKYDNEGSAHGHRETVVHAVNINPGVSA